MSQTRSKLRLGTYVLHHEKDLEYYQALQSHLLLMLKESDLGYLRHETLNQFNFRDKVMQQVLDVPNCLVCLITPNFVHAISEQRFLWSELVHAHRHRQLLILPILAEDVEHYRKSNLLRAIPTVLPACPPLSELEPQGSNRATWLAQLGNACREKMEAALHHHQQAGKHWRRTRAYHNTDEYETFGDNFGHTKYGPEAERYRQELLEEELWKMALATNDAAGYLEYLIHSPLHTHHDEAVTCIVTIKINAENVRYDVANNTDIGLVFDYKFRFRDVLDYELVQDKLRDSLSDPLRLRGDYPWPELEAMYLKRKVYEECTSAESLSYSLLEEYAKSLREATMKVLKKLKGQKSNAAFYSLLPVIVLLFFAVVDQLLSTGVVSTILIGLGRLLSEHYVLGPIFLATPIYLFWNTFKYLKREIATCDKVIEAITRELVHLQIAFIVKTEYGQHLRELHNMEEWGQIVLQKGLLAYAFAEEEEMEFHSHVLREMVVLPPAKK